MTTNGYVTQTVNSMLGDLTRPVDITGQYGPQSVDLIIYYVRELTGVKWAGPTQHARDLMIAPGLRIWFDAVDPDSARYGDIVVLHGFDTSDFGTTGVYFGGDSIMIRVFSQTPGDPRVMQFRRESIVGVLRYKYVGPINKTNVLHEPYSIDRLWTPDSDEPRPLREALLKDTPAEKRAVLGEFMTTGESKTAGEECVEAYDKWVAQQRGINLDELNQPGDIIVWDSDALSQYGHTAIVYEPPAPWWQRVTNWLGITRPKQYLVVQDQEPKE
ncbi:endolysin [Arthrobacter phage JKerns]|uniref:Endolysin n=1 Tax=Arthrobacter phage JKerns TaxID=2719212 RepID=A0A6G9LDX3_9CAUD|nr:endolysin [Arthrobacter phage JKerns]